MSWRGSRGSVGLRPLTDPSNKRLCATTLTSMASQGQRRRRGSRRSNGGRNRPPPQLGQDSTQPLCRGLKPLRADR